MTPRPRTRAYEYIDELLRRFVSAHGRLPTLDTIQSHLAAAPRNLNSSFTTIRRGLDAWAASDEGAALLLAAKTRIAAIEAGGVGAGAQALEVGATAHTQSPGTAVTPSPSPLAPSALFLTWEAELRATVAKEISAQEAARAQVEIDRANADRDAAIANSSRTVQNAEQIRLHAEAKSDREVGEARATVVAMQSSFDRLAATHAVALASLESEANASAQVWAQKEVALVTAAAKERETALTTQNAMLAKIVEEGSETIAALQAQMLSREERAAEQFRGQSQHHGQQIADYKTRIDGLEKVLLAERRRADGAEGSVVAQAVSLLTDELRKQNARAEATVAIIVLNSKATLNEVRQMRDEAKTVADQTATRVVEAAIDRLSPQIGAASVEKKT
jgi:hypothetical protein